MYRATNPLQLKKEYRCAHCGNLNDNNAKRRSEEKILFEEKARSQSSEEVKVEHPLPQEPKEDLDSETAVVTEVSEKITSMEDHSEAEVLDISTEEK